MKLSYRYGYRRADIEYSFSEAVLKQVVEAGGRSDGQIEALAARVAELSEIVGRLLEHLVEKQHPLSREEWIGIIGHGWEKKS